MPPLFGNWVVQIQRIGRDPGLEKLERTPFCDARLSTDSSNKPFPGVALVESRGMTKQNDGHPTHHATHDIRGYPIAKRRGFEMAEAIQVPRKSLRRSIVNCCVTQLLGSSEIRENRGFFVPLFAGGADERENEQAEKRDQAKRYQDVLHKLVGRRKDLTCIAPRLLPLGAGPAESGDAGLAVSGLS